jgi:hypothetical protein
MESCGVESLSMLVWSQWDGVTWYVGMESIVMELSPQHHTKCLLTK